MSFEELQGGAGVVVQPSPYESARFGRSFVRVTVASTADRGELRAALEAVDADVVVARYAGGDADLPAVFAATGRAVIACSPLTYWRLPVGSGRRPTSDEALDVVPGQELGSGQVVVDDVVAASFAAYANHYANNPLLDRAAALEGYQEWARRTPAENVLVLRAHAEPVGVATLCVGTLPEPHLEILLAGLVPSAQGRGWYAHLLAACEDLAAARGASALVISTQADNTGVQRAWARVGFEPMACYATLHLLRPELLP